MLEKNHMFTDRQGQPKSKVIFGLYVTGDIRSDKRFFQKIMVVIFLCPVPLAGSQLHAIERNKHPAYF